MEDTPRTNDRDRRIDDAAAEANQSRRTPASCAKRARRQRWIIGLALTVLCAVLAVQYARKASDHRSAFVRWRGAVGGVLAGEEIYGPGYQYPNPPIMALILQPIARLPVLPGAMLWFAAKVAMTVAAAVWTFQLVCDGEHPIAGWALLVTLALSLRPIMSDLMHGNVNLMILFLVVASLRAFRAGWDRTSGLVVGLATACKVTPALLCAYLLYKRAWKAAAWSGIGLVLFLLVLPSAVLGSAANAKLLHEWAEFMVLPYVVDGYVMSEQANQSIPGVVTRLLSDVDSVELGDGRQAAINVAALDSATLRWIIRAACLPVLLALVIACRTPTDQRDRWRLSCEYGLVLMGMLFLSERSWKHHYVTMLIPYAAICYALAGGALSRRWKVALVSTLAASALLMATTSSEIGQLIFGPLGHKYAQGYGTFLMAGMVVFAATAALLVWGPERIVSQTKTPSAVDPSHRFAPKFHATEQSNAATMQPFDGTTEALGRDR